MVAQGLAKNLMSGDSAAPDFERQFLDDLVKEMTQFRAAYEHLMLLLTTFKTPEAAPLLSRALKSIDEINSTMAMYQDVRIVLLTRSSLQCRACQLSLGPRKWAKPI